MDGPLNSLLWTKAKALPSFNSYVHKQTNIMQWNKGKTFPWCLRRPGSCVTSYPQPQSFPEKTDLLYILLQLRDIGKQLIMNSRFFHSLHHIVPEPEGFDDCLDEAESRSISTWPAPGEIGYWCLKILQWKRDRFLSMLGFTHTILPLNLVERDTGDHPSIQGCSGDSDPLLHKYLQRKNLSRKQNGPQKQNCSGPKCLYRSCPNTAVL